ncbi:MAG TPA: amino acid ABC transporter substrate-binding protein [Xanthobacteraceae bacterium]|jgi:general L-amino acid transport system substrate-binding protein|nr:amino acid ABC transporter substrate-binding protein [Xanthobacteraceae bacterium]
MKRMFIMAALAGLATLNFTVDASAQTTLSAVKARDKVICGANGGRPGFSGLDSKGQWQGIDVDVCRAVAAATVGDANKTQFVKVTSQTRFTALQTSEVDILTANVSWTLKRDTSLGLDFAPPIFYDGQGLMVRKDLGVKSSKDLDGATICVEPGSTSEKMVADIFRANKLSYKPVVIEDRKELNNAFFNGRCDVHVQSVSGLSSGRATAAANPDDYIILPEIHGKDPMGPVIRQGDAQWRDIVTWSVYAMMAAEEFGITSQNVDEMKKSTNADIARLLGSTDDLGKTLGLDKEWAYRIIKQVGNYGEVFERTLGKGSPLKLDRGLNKQWKDGGLIYAPPFN